MIKSYDETLFSIGLIIFARILTQILDTARKQQHQYKAHFAPYLRR